MSKRPETALPGALGEIESLCGRKAALNFSLRFGGQQIYIPRPGKVTPGHELVAVLGEADALAIASRFWGECLYIPLARRDVALAMLDQGKSVAETAIRLKRSVRTIQRYRKIAR